MSEDGGLAALRERFPDVDGAIVQAVLMECGGSIPRAVGALFELFPQCAFDQEYLSGSDHGVSKEGGNDGCGDDAMNVSDDGQADHDAGPSGGNDSFGEDDGDGFLDDGDDGFPDDDDDGFPDDGFPDDDDDEFPDGDLGNSGDTYYPLNQSNKLLQSSDAREFTALTPEAIWDLQHSAMRQVSGILTSLPPYCARVLLSHFHWDANRALASFSEDPDRLCRKLGIPPPEDIAVVEFDKDDFYCPVCDDDVEEDEYKRLQCGHGMCVECWQGYLGMHVKERKAMIECPGMSGGAKCKMVMDEFVVIELLDDKQGEARLKETMIRTFVDTHPSCKWCPKAGCKNAVLLNLASGEGNEVVVCECGHRFCFRCGLVDHRPASCDMYTEWQKKTSGQDDTLNELKITQISRPCPNCKIPIEKNSGCSHMHCQACKYHFCWQCMGKFGSGRLGSSDGYGTHRCNGNWTAQSASASSVDDLKRFEFYSKRSDNHNHSLLLDKKLLEVVSFVEQQLNDLYELSWIGSQFYRAAVEQLVQNRITLKMSYAFGYFRDTHAPYVNVELFENLQFDVERHTEKLSELVGNADITPERIERLFATRMEITNQTKVAHAVVNALLETASEWDMCSRGATSARSTSIASSSKVNPRATPGKVGRKKRKKRKK